MILLVILLIIIVWWICSKKQENLTNNSWTQSYWIYEIIDSNGFTINKPADVKSNNIYLTNITFPTDWNSRVDPNRLINLYFKISDNKVIPVYNNKYKYLITKYEKENHESLVKQNKQIAQKFVFTFNTQ